MSERVIESGDKQFVYQFNDDGFQKRLIYAGLFFCFALHLIYHIFFLGIGISTVFFYNAFSLIFYGGLILFYKKIGQEVLFAVYLEMLIFVAWTTIDIGWQAGFQWLLFATVVVSHVLTSRKRWVFYLLNSLSFFLFIGLYLQSANRPVLVSTTALQRGLTLFNLVTVSSLLLFSQHLFAVIARMIRFNLYKKTNQLQGIAQRDDLTGLYNRYGMEEVLYDFHTAAQERRQQFALVFADVDDFKQVNDTYGHARGDQMLIKVGKALVTCFREKDVVARWGGEEFLILLPLNQDDKIYSIVETVRQKIEQNCLSEDSTICLRMTFGIIKSSPYFNINDMIELADRAMYIGKSRGKNQTVLVNVDKTSGISYYQEGVAIKKDLVGDGNNQLADII